MNSNEANFRMWYLDALEPLRGKGHTGFIFAMVAFPLLERYLREKSGAGEIISLTDSFHVELGVLFPDIAGRERQFWACYRHGLLHQATFKQQSPTGTLVITSGLSGHDPRPVYFDVIANAYYLNPVAFFDQVTAKILSDFSTFEGSLSPSHQFPLIIDPLSAISGVVPTIGAPFPGSTGNYNP